jgi:hypothetical protein
MKTEYQDEVLKVKPLFEDMQKIMDQIEEDQSKISIEDGCVMMRWNSQHGYAVDFARVKGWAHLVDWMLHLCGKGWMNPNRLRLFAETVIKEKNWKRPDA